MPQRLLTESGNNLVMETVAGISGASSLNDTTVYEITKEFFTTNPTLSGWVFGTGWAWNAGNGNMEIV